MNPPLEIYMTRELRVQVAGGIVRDPGKIDHRIEALEIGGTKMTNVYFDRLEAGFLLVGQPEEHVIAEVEAVYDLDGVPLCQEASSQD
jgi:hypothetical protein